jgi:hypothetical protein
MPDHNTGPRDGHHAARPSGTRGPAEWLCLAAAPTLALMALLTGIRGGEPADMLCSAAGDASPLGGMAAMYLLMAAFHAPPWLKLLSGSRESRHTCHSRTSPPAGRLTRTTNGWRST